jgi:hypothetical protein
MKNNLDISIDSTVVDDRIIDRSDSDRIPRQNECNLEKDLITFIREILFTSEKLLCCNTCLNKKN